MGVREQLTNWFLEWPVRDLSLAEMAEKLDVSGGRLQRTFAAAQDSPQNCRLLSHIVGIERWGQSRLRVALGAALARDEYDGYRPPRAATWAELQDAFSDTRQETVALARQLAQLDLAEVTVPHNQFGGLTVRSWLRYLDMHASWEAKKLR
jgi:hypothetical protein